ncbi:MAG: SUMF1/EgtB/PvdO family nonheme iron enzyme [Sporocytophaga sp.]|uniref:SUMF1/EgtB/PvdO family nonheme iron enzyme n=1 Tax=Sporocytophaga sp. TaxID=2231183 RepID=UPI001B053326|nr:SUMF1/EgtB/PvdO family nonheme iron enzyme [Sporocytophaga sp.]MBO9701838.1 SUMF1/EgtB/PvdO family nonheme iron enzyme [Sporocytophaga sp.]
MSYCQWLSEYVNDCLTKKNLFRLPNFRLPSEFEWTYAATDKNMPSISLTMCDSVGLAHKAQLKEIKDVRCSKKNDDKAYGLNDNVFEWMEDDYYPKMISLMNIPMFGDFYIEETLEAVVRKHGFIYDTTRKNNCGREARIKNGFYSDTGFRIVQIYLGISTGYEF